MSVLNLVNGTSIFLKVSLNFFIAWYTDGTVVMCVIHSEGAFSRS
jgi:hypothetical protein